MLCHRVTTHRHDTNTIRTRGARARTPPKSTKQRHTCAQLLAPLRARGGTARARGMRTQRYPAALQTPRSTRARGPRKAQPHTRPKHVQNKPTEETEQRAPGGPAARKRLASMLRGEPGTIPQRNGGPARRKGTPTRGPPAPRQRRRARKHDRDKPRSSLPFSPETWYTTVHVWTSSHHQCPGSPPQAFWIVHQPCHKGG